MSKYECDYCGEYSNGFPLCRKCYQLRLNGELLQSNTGLWYKNVTKGKEERYYQEDKNYHRKEHLMTKTERIFFEKALKKIDSKKYAIYPQVSLQSIIDTDSNTRNEELFRIVDFLVVDKKEQKPLLIIEINGPEHYSDDVTIARDESVFSITDATDIEILTLTNNQAINISNKKLKKLLFKTIELIVKQPKFLREQTVNEIAEEIIN